MLAILASCSAPKEVLYLQDIASLKEEVDNSHGYHFRLDTYHTQYSIPHNGGTRVYTQYNFLFDRLYHTITSINVGKPITLSLKIFSNSSFSFTPCS